MNQDELLEQLWVEAINAVDDVTFAGAPQADPTDVQRVARLARYEALFAWCYAFDESGRTVGWWLKKSVEHPDWLELYRWSEEAASQRPDPDPGMPFSDAEEAWVRLLDSKVSSVALAAWLTTQGALALEQLRAILRGHKWPAGELGGMHESLLMADPSGHEGRPGSWPAEVAELAEEEPSPQGPRRVLKKAHALAFSPDGARVVAAKGGAITDLASGKVLAKCALLSNTSYVTWSPDGRWIAGTSTSGDIAICAADTGARVHVLSRNGEGVAPRFTNDRELVRADWGGGVFRWDVEQGRLLAAVQFNADLMIKGLEVTEGGNLLLLIDRREPDVMECVRFSPDLKQCLRVLPVPDWASDLAYAGSGGRALLTGGEHAAWLDLETGALSGQVDLPDPLTAGSVSPDGRWVVLTSLTGGSFRISPAEDLASGRVQALQFANEATFSADSRQVALATWKEGEVWDVEALRRVTAE